MEPALSGKRPQTADSASGGFVHQIPPLPVPISQRDSAHHKSLRSPVHLFTGCWNLVWYPCFGALESLSLSVFWLVPIGFFGIQLCMTARKNAVWIMQCALNSKLNRASALALVDTSIFNSLSRTQRTIPVRTGGNHD